MDQQQLIDRLREWWSEPGWLTSTDPDKADLLAAAAAEVERLRSIVAKQEDEGIMQGGMVAWQASEIDRLREERQWICVHDRLPDPYDHVLIHRFGETDIAYLTAPPQGFWYRTSDDCPVDPKYWQPLPAPPKEEE